jgi:hypothetical protein
MRTVVLAIALIFMLNDWGGRRSPARSATNSPEGVSTATLGREAGATIPSRSLTASNPAFVGNSQVRVDFDSQVKPILQSKCMPCHFNGGVMYERMPFDRAETIKKLGTKLFTRIHDENQRRVIREFLEQE